MSMKDFIDTLNDSQKKALLDALMQNSETTLKDIPEEVKQETKSQIKEDFRVSSIKGNNNKRREPVKARKNEWVDEGEDRHIETKYGARTPRSREPNKKMDVECSVCGRSFKTDPKYVYGEYHRCSRCIGR
jgi:hypothetical protein